MKKTILFLFILFAQNAFAQNWTAYPAGSTGVPYINGLMTATVTPVNTTMNSGTPMYTTSTSPDCYIATGGLALNAGFFNSYLVGASNITVFLDFTTGGFNGTCNSATFSIKDINSGETFTDFLDVVEVSGLDANNTAIATGSISVVAPAFTTVSTVGSAKKIVGHNAGSEVITGGPYFSSPCNSTLITVTPPIGVPLKSVTIVYRPGVGTSGLNAYFTAGLHPAVQYISISNLTLSPMGGGCVPLPVELISFQGEHQTTENLLVWSTATEVNNNYFVVEKSEDAANFVEMERVFGNGNSNTVSNYSTTDKSPFSTTYYRLCQYDYDGTKTILRTISVDATAPNETLFNIFPNPAKDQLSIQTFLKGENLITIKNIAGQDMFNQVVNGIDMQTISLNDFPAGIFILTISNNGKSQNRKLVVSK